MDESILNSIKRMLDIDPNYTVFDSVIMIHINSALSTLHQLGVGPSNGYAVSDADSTWNNLLSGNKLLNSVKSYIFISVKMVFDPPTNSFAVDALQKQKVELEWRLNVAVEPAVTSIPGSIDVLDGGTP